MPTINLPSFSVAGSIVKILEKIKTAGTPDNFNGDFLTTTLGFKGGNYRTFIPWAKKIGFINSDGTPTALYKKFRNPSTSKSSLGEGLKKGYAEIFLKDENADKLDKAKLKGLMMEATGLAHDSKVLENIVNTFWNAKSIAEFEDLEENILDNSIIQIEKQVTSSPDSTKKRVNLGLNYTINLVLPKTDDPAIYNAIFKSLRENLLND